MFDLLRSRKFWTLCIQLLQIARDFYTFVITQDEATALCYAAFDEAFRPEPLKGL